MSYKYLFKYVIIGNTGCGKSCILKRFVEDDFTNIHDITIGIEFGVNNIVAKNGQKIKIQIWDTAGQEMFRSITRSYYRGATVAVVVFDITCYETFKDINKWFEEISYMMSNDKSVVILVGNKSDLSNKRKVTTEEAKKLAAEHGCFYIETSAKSGYNVENIFRITMEKVLENIENGFPIPGYKDNIKDDINNSNIYETPTNRTCCYLM